MTAPAQTQKVALGQIYYHVQYGFGDDGDEAILEIGVFESRKSARTVVAKLKAMPGFKRGQGKFWISRGIVGHVGWSSGFGDE